MNENVETKRKALLTNSLIQVVVLIGGVAWISHTNNIIGNTEGMRFWPLASLIVVGIMLFTRFNSLRKPLDDWQRETELLELGAVAAICAYVLVIRIDQPNALLYVTSTLAYSLSMIVIVNFLIKDFATKPIRDMDDTARRYFTILPLVVVYSHLLYKDYLAAAMPALNVSTLMMVPLATGTILAFFPFLGWFRKFGYVQRILTMLIVALVLCLGHGLLTQLNYGLSTREGVSILLGLAYLSVIALAGVSYYLIVKPQLAVGQEQVARTMATQLARTPTPTEQPTNSGQ